MFVTCRVDLVCKCLGVGDFCQVFFGLKYMSKCTCVVFASPRVHA